MSIRDKVREEVVDMELFHTYTLDKNEQKIYRYEMEGYDKEKIETEGSSRIVYVMDCRNDYYNKHKKEIEETVDEILRNALNS